MISDKELDSIQAEAEEHTQDYDDDAILRLLAEFRELRKSKVRQVEEEDD